MKIIDLPEVQTHYYLEKYSKLPKDKFATIKISGDSIDKSLDNVVEQISELQKLNLFPVVVFGWGSIVNEIEKFKGEEIKFIDGNRYTSKETIDSIIKAVNIIENKIESLSHKFGLNYELISNGDVFDAHKFDDNLGYVGNIDNVNTSSIVNIINSKKIPFVAPIGYDGNSLLNINADDASAAIFKKMSSQKYILITETGGILDSNNTLIKKFSVLEDLPYLQNEGILKGGMLKKADVIGNILNSFKDFKYRSAQIISPKDILEELFSFKGTGTKVTRGYKVHQINSFDNLEISSVKKLIEDGFKETLNKDYFKNKFNKIFIEDDYDGIIISKEIYGWLYLDKIVVSNKAKGTGLGNKLFSEIYDFFENSSEYSGIFWRSKMKDSLNNWYHNKVINYGGGCLGSKKWVTYWIGDEFPSKEIIDYTNSKKIDWVKK